MAAYYRPRYRTWYRPSHGTVPRPVAIGAAVLVAAGMASGVGHVTHHHHHHASAVIAAPGGPGMRAWAQAFLADASLPGTACDRAAVLAWIGAEGSNPAWHNPLDSTQPEPGSYAINSVGVQAYTSRQQGLAATVTTIRNGYYPDVLAALDAGQDAQAVADAVSASPWGTQPFTAQC